MLISLLLICLAIVPFALWKTAKQNEWDSRRFKPRSAATVGWIIVMLLIAGGFLMIFANAANIVAALKGQGS